MVRCIVTSTKSGDREQVIFTADMDIDASDHCAPGFTVDVDEEVGDLPSGFPMEYTFERQ